MRRVAHATASANLQDGDAHEADAVVGRQLHAYGGLPHEGKADGAHMGRQRRQPQLDPQLALQVQLAYQYGDLIQSTSHALHQHGRKAIGRKLPVETIASMRALVSQHMTSQRISWHCRTAKCHHAASEAP